jgi:hypothetical protein
MSIKDFTERFTKHLGPKETRELIRRRGRTRLSIAQCSLLKYLVGCAFGSGKKRLVTVSIPAMERGSDLSYRAVRYNLEVLIEHGLITRTAEGITVHCEPMQEWPTRKEANAEALKKKRAQERIASAAYRARKAMNAATLEVEAEINHIIKHAEREGQ